MLAIRLQIMTTDCNHNMNDLWTRFSSHDPRSDILMMLHRGVPGLQSIQDPLRAQRQWWFVLVAASTPILEC